MSETPLQRLVSRQKDAERLSYADIARRGGLPRSTVYAIATGDFVTPPRPDTLRRLAKGLGLPLTSLKEAAAESSGYYRYEEPVDAETKVLFASIEELSPEQRAQVSALVSAMLGKKPSRR